MDLISSYADSEPSLVRTTGERLEPYWSMTSLVG